MKTGHIRLIDGKVKFEYCELEKPDSYTYERARDFNFDCSYYQNEIKEYEASRKLVEVSNYWREFNRTTGMIVNKVIELIENNQPCKAEVNDKATIIELT